MAEDITPDAAKNTEPSPNADPKSTTPSQGGSADDKPRTFTQEDIDRITARTRKEEKAKYEKELENAKKTELEVAQAEARDLRARLVERESKDEVTALLSKAGCTRPEAAYRLVQSSITRGKDGKIEDAKALLAEAKELAPEFFPDSKKTGSADAGAKGDGGTSTNMNAWIRG